MACRSATAIAAELTARNATTLRGGKWLAMTVLRIMQRLGLGAKACTRFPYAESPSRRIAAVLWYFLGRLILFIAAFVPPIRGWLRVCRRFPRRLFFYGSRADRRPALIGGPSTRGALLILAASGGHLAR